MILVRTGNLPASEAEGLFRLLFGDVADFKHDSASFDFGDIELRFTFTATHFHIERFLGDWGMREDANQILPPRLT